MMREIVVATLDDGRRGSFHSLFLFERSFVKGLKCILQLIYSTNNFERGTARKIRIEA